MDEFDQEMLEPKDEAFDTVQDIGFKITVKKENLDKLHAKIKKTFESGYTVTIFCVKTTKFNLEWEDGL